VSKISDALEKADREKQVREQSRVTEAASSELGPSVSQGIPVKVWRELGLMRNQVESRLSTRKSCALLVTSAGPEEGVSTVTANFAGVLADDPVLNVLVVDVNPTDAMQHELFGLDNTRGFVELARGDLKPEDSVKATPRKNLSVITSGTASGGIFQLVGTERVAGLITNLKARFHYLLFDAPPVLTHPETALLGSHMDGVLLVVRTLRTRREAVARARDTLAQSGCNVIGVVLNRYKYSIPEFIYKRV
jgi:capsular exopolysaccharide synthesis family protein